MVKYSNEGIALSKMASNGKVSMYGESDIDLDVALCIFYQDLYHLAA